MAELRNTVSGHVAGSVVQAGYIDAVYLPGSQVPDGPPLTSWQDRPELPDVLRDLLAAQHRATETLPYKLLGVKQPELTQVYVQQTMRTQSSPAEAGERAKPPAEGGERTMSVTEALNRNGHLLVTGEPGSGKSTVGYMYVRQIADYWLNALDGRPPLTEPVLPLRIPARALADNKAWAELLAAGAEEALGRLLSTRPAAELFARRALGARWLVFVDGLDEIIETDTRAQVIEAIAHQLRRTDQRLVITTRPLAGNELKPLERAGVERYEIQPFGPVELDEFALSWFQAQNRITARTRKDEFVRQVRDGRLRELVRNPLLATIAAIANTVEPDRPLPNSRVDLYARFMAYLLDDHASRRDPLSELRKSLAGQPSRVALVEWAHENRVELVEQLAVRRLETESPLLDAAYDWVRANRSSLPDGWQDDVHSVLGSTGVFAPADENLVFRHHSFAEFLAARRRAGEIPAEFPDLDEWIARGLSGAKRVFALFTFVLWGREDHDLGRVLTTLLAGTGDKVLLAGRLLAEEIRVDADLSATVVDRLLDLLLANGVRDDPWSDVEDVGDVLGEILPAVLGDAALARLRELRDAPEIAEAIRIECAVVLGRLTDPDAEAAWLAEFAETAGWGAVKRVVEALPDLVSNGADRAERLLVAMAADHLSTLTVISLLQELDRTEPARRLIRSLCAQLRDQPSRLLPLGDTRLADELDVNTPSWGVLAGAAARSDCHAEALWAAELAFAQPDITVYEAGEAVKALLTAKGSDGVAEAVSSVSGGPIRHLLKAAMALREENHSKETLELVRQAVTTAHITPSDFGRAATVFVQCGATAELLRIIDESLYVTAAHLVRLPATPETLDRMRIALNDTDIDPWDLQRAATALINPDDPNTAAEIRDAARRHGPAHWGQVAVVLFNAGYAELGIELFRPVSASKAVTRA